tara:strand:+ start:326 stop:964 length:639 start_codon:yes stop_codon:yes gene_type:complete
VKIGGTERTVQERVDEHMRSGDFKSFELIETYPVGDVWVCEKHIKWNLSLDPKWVAPSFTEVWSKSITPELIAAVYAYLYSGQTEKSDKALKRYQELAKQNDILEAQGIFQPIWPNRSHHQPHGTLAAPVSDLLGVLWLLVFFVLTPVVMFCLFHLLRAAAIFCAGVAWFFSTYTEPFLVGAAWVALCAIPITACVFIYRYGMKLAAEHGEA